MDFSPPPTLAQLLNALQQQLDQVQEGLEHMHAVTSQRWQTLATSLTEELTAARRKSQMLEQSLYETFLRIATAVQYRDQRNGEHLTRLSQYTMLLALQLGLPESEIRVLYATAPLYDIGKVGIPDAILLKPGRLMDAERTVLEIHPTLGTSLLGGLPSSLLETASTIALTHHEHWDGSGYPQGLKGEAIPLGGRLVLLAERYEALRSVRPYKPALTHSQAQKILVEGDALIKPEHFDPQVLEAFCTIHQDFATIHDRRTN
ncbi:MAG: HD-GYP domain-containing protein [Candidatus Binatia bacterium]